MKMITAEEIKNNKDIKTYITCADKSLKTLVEVNLVQELNVGEGNFRYDANNFEHCHIQCVKCGKVEDLMDLPLPNLNALVEENTEYKVNWNKIFFYGLCKECQ